MPAKLIDLYLSGGAVNTDVNASLGGVVSSSEMGTNTVTYTSTSIPGVTLVDSEGFKVDGSVGNIRVTNSGAIASYQRTGGVVALSDHEVDVTVADGKYVLTCQEDDANITIDVINASIGSDQTNIAIEQALPTPNLFTDVLEPEAQVGSSKYRHLYLKNNSLAPISLGVYIPSNYNGLDTLSIGFSSLISGVQDELLADEGTAPISVNFKTPIKFEDSEILIIQPAAYLGMYLRRTVSALSDISTSPSVASLYFELY